MDTQEMSINFAQQAADINRLNSWLFNIIYPYIKGRTLDLGSADGGIASLYIERGLPTHLTAKDEINGEKLRQKFEGIPTIRAIHDINFNHPAFEQVYASGAGVFSTIVAVNLAEHGCYDKQMLCKAEHFLAPAGHFIVVTSAKAVLFNKIASNLEDLREYNYKIARNLMGNTFEILKVRYFNWLANHESRDPSPSGLYTLVISRKK